MKFYIWRVWTGKLVCLLWSCLPGLLPAQTPDTSCYGFRHLRMMYKGDPVEILVKSGKGTEMKVKPLLLFCQGSLPVPLIITYDAGGQRAIYPVFVFNPDSLSAQYHLVIIGKPYIPLVADQKNLTSDLTCSDSTGNFPRQYIARNLLSYYVNRNKAVIRFLRKQSWVSQKELVVAGHSEGSTIAAKLAMETPAVTALIYSGGNPMGRIMTIITRSRQVETDSTQRAAADIRRWEEVVANKQHIGAAEGDSPQTTYEFSIPPIRYLRKLKIPVLVSYGSKDAGAPFNDYWQVETIRQKRKNFTFRTYVGTEHNYFPLKADGSINYDIFNWDRVAADWRKWLIAK
ncbi:hypothetical protein [Chitinophaga nivalis]|uniref:BAAT/Acyl-CoA thioester hydrolase C-terminal domain-containing protein n=1 Tax=Chitinophaga nivalis TaxID=2991709 RepID=A0ABT3IJW1_9BACT|nr:hypothetical protein [Chitinophaga nivalis]MCW3466061.1 hypothetical protein [Chitinophaga nivalis]MCW3484248.1 hypothetical protein [Chitinophaga nivalis]